MLSTNDRVRIVSCLVEGCSVRATCRMTGFAKGTVLKLLSDLGRVCEAYHSDHVHGLQTKRLQCDEIWAFVGAKNRNLPADKLADPRFGSVWTWTAIDADTKFMVSWGVGERTREVARDFMEDVASRIASDRVQVTTDGFNAYRAAVLLAFGEKVDLGQAEKVFGTPQSKSPEQRYSPAVCLGCIRRRIKGNPDERKISTSFAERANLTMRMGMRRFTRLTNAFSKKIENHAAAVSLHFMHYNFCRVHQTLKTTPAMKAGMADHVWTLAELVAVLERSERAFVGTEVNKRGPYKAKNSN